MIFSSATFAGGRRLLPALFLLALSMDGFAHGVRHHNHDDHRNAHRAAPEERRLQRAFEAAPTPEAAVRLGRYLLEHFRANGDERKLEQAQRLLGPWPDAAAPHAVTLLRADLYQAAHRFREALALYRTLTAQDPQAIQPWLNLASVSLVVGDATEAERACKALLLLDSVVSGLCLANVMAQTNPNGAQRFIEAQLATGAAKRAGVDLWAHTLAGDAAHRAGALDAAQYHYARALALSQRDGEASLYLRIAHADVLLDQGQPRAALARLRDAPDTLGVAIRRGRALRELEAPELAALVNDLRARLQALEADGPEGHERELAMAAHYLFDQPAAARRWAQRNWQTQREWIDARLLAET